MESIVKNQIEICPPRPIVSRARAFTCLMLNIIVFPGVGTLLSGDRTLKRTGMIQFGLGALLTPLFILMSVGSAVFAGADPELVKAWLWNFMMLLVLWNVFTGVKLFLRAWRESKPSLTVSSSI